MEKALLLAIAASLCTATASVCQRLGAKSDQTAAFDVWLVFRLARRQAWLLGIASMILGFAFQLSALRYGALALVQPILALELLFVFGYLAVAGSRRVKVKRRDWLAAVAMSAGIGLFLRVASPSGGRLHAPGSSWWLAGLVTSAVVLLALAVAFGPGNRPGASRPRRAAVLGAATGISAAVRRPGRRAGPSPTQHDRAHPDTTHVRPGQLPPEHEPEPDILRAAHGASSAIATHAESAICAVLPGHGCICECIDSPLCKR